MEYCDVLIVGGGPAGSSMAWRLRESGKHVIIMDKDTFPRNKVCAGWITPAVIQTLQINLDDLQSKCVLQPIYGFKVGMIGGTAVEIIYAGGPVSYGIRRCEFDNYLLQRCGAELQLAQPVHEIVREDKLWCVNKTYKTPLLVGAGGYFCPVARYAGMTKEQNAVAVRAQEIEFEMTPQQAGQCRIDAQTPELYFCNDLKGYGWVFRKENYLNIGLGREDDKGLRAQVKDFCHFLQANGRIAADIPEKFYGHAYLLYRHARRPLCKDGIILIGDAAGLAYTQSGEGIRPAVESGLMAARTVLDANGDYATEQLDKYAQMISKRFGRRDSDKIIGIQFPDSFKQFLADKLLACNWFVKHVVMDRWFLHCKQTPLV